MVKLRMPMKFVCASHIVALLILSSVSPPALGADPFKYERTYKVGEKFGYKFSMKRTSPNQPALTASGQTAHEVKEVDLAPGEMVRWSSLVESDQRGLQDHAAAIKKAEPFLLGLPPLARRGFMEKLPSEISRFSNELYQFYQMIDTSVLGVRVQKAGEKYTYPTPLSRHFSGNGGIDTMSYCYERSIELVSADAKRAKIRVKDVPPKACPNLRLPAAFMNSQIKNVPVNIGMIRQPANGRTDLNWGTESVEYNIEVDASTGIILKATREDKTQRINRFGCDAQYKNCRQQGMAPGPGGTTPTAPMPDTPNEETQTLTIDLVR